ncbi:PilN domain-containing protein [Sporolactobacillus sp. STSJ-5]|uniref:PilN domain-containing protein n=1 Tax=Sporolactobacillus sp. STSJ-5 TaxID=2965076 RepID=UPI0021023BA3|nr:PilN domain-containing protein [Sporolactobacillus sp. STSJ-5]MCQ2008511.1 PilN domain-containing protein [Sporolactobacillus sp. STSJ-5]
MIDINLLPYEQKASRGMIWFAIIFGAFCLAGLIILGVYSWQLNGELQNVQKQEATWKARAEKKAALKETEVSTKPTPADAVNEIQLSRFAVFPSWVLMEKQLPKNGTITNIDYDSTGNMEITGEFAHFADIQPFIEKLRKQNYFSNVVTTKINQLDSSSNVLVYTQRNAYQLTFTMRTDANLSINQKKDQ